MTADERAARLRASFLMRHYGKLAWSLWVGSTAVTVMAVWLWAPRSTMDDWVGAAGAVVLATGVPLVFLRLHLLHQLAGNVGRGESWLVGLVVFGLVVVFGWQAAGWGQAHGLTVRGWPDRVALVWFLAMAPGVGVAVLGSHWNALARDHRRKAGGEDGGLE